MAKVYPDEWFGNMHRLLVKYVGHYARDEIKSSTGGIIPRNWGGVRVFEEHPGGHGLHAHWVMRGRMDWRLMQKAALRAGFGKIVHVDPKPATLDSAYYLACYLTKNNKLRGVRQWANIGTYDGLGKRDIEMTSPRIEKIKALAKYYREIGVHRMVAYYKAVAEVSRHDLDVDAPF